MAVGELQEPVPIGRRSPESKHLEAQKKQTRAHFLLDQALLHQITEQAVNRGLAQTRGRGNIRKTGAPGGLQGRQRA
jgi:hypothetical protein